MNLPSEIFGDVIVLHTPEELTSDHAEALVVYATGLERSNIVVDLDSTETIDSEGLESLLDVRDGLMEQNGDLKVATTSRTNRKILELTRLDQQLEVFDSVIDAVRSFH